jgi:SAM-dependent methyltransferase
MKRCLACGTIFETHKDRCPECGVTPVRENGFPSYAPSYAHDGGGFKANYFANLAKLEEANFWFRARNKLITWALAKYKPDLKSFLEIGCGTGYVLSGIAREFPEVELRGSEIFLAGLGFAAARLPAVNFIQMDARDIPYLSEFDCVGAFDVLEHITEDERVLHQVYESLKPGGVLLLTVPQHAWLWSPVDEYACHVRRYSASEILQKLTRANFHILTSTSFVSTLLPAMVISRFLQSKQSVEAFDAAAELKVHPALNKILSFALAIEVKLIKLGMRLPVGGSRLVVARREE